MGEGVRGTACTGGYKGVRIGSRRRAMSTLLKLFVSRLTTRLFNNICLNVNTEHRGIKTHCIKTDFLFAEPICRIRVYIRASFSFTRKTQIRDCDV